MTATTLGGALYHPAEAKKSSTWKTGAIVGAAATGYGLLKHKTGVTVLGALGTAYSYSQYKKYKKRENNEEARRQAWYQQRYGRNWRNHYVPG
jgi:hypothetical protein